MGKKEISGFEQPSAGHFQGSEFPKSLTMQESRTTANGYSERGRTVKQGFWCLGQEQESMTKTVTTLIDDVSN